MSDDAVVAQKGPYQMALEADKPYFWCTCGRSQKQPFCDGNHKGTTFLPQKFSVAAAATYNLCGGKTSDDKPFCDGTHNML
jgi:CDGSH iron-sulfur domain-containing protein 3